MRGWSSSLLGLGQIGWNSLDGHNGSVSLFGLVGYSYSDSGPNSVSVAGISVSSDGVAFDAVQFTMAAITVLSAGASASAAGAKAASALGTTADAGAKALVAKQAAVGSLTSDAIAGAVGGAVMSAFTGKNSGTPTAPSSGYWQYSKKVKQKLFHKEYKIWLDQTRNEKMFGTMYLSKANSGMTALPNTPINFVLKY
jgi:hypothetical protein